jgi:two-component system chemotaxis response regulator CheB
VTLAIVVDDFALAAVPGLDADLAREGALVMRSFRNLPNPNLLRVHRGAAVVGGRDRAALHARLERATATLAAPVIGILPAGVTPTAELRGPGVVDLVPAGARGVAGRILLMAGVPVVRAGARGAAVGAGQAAGTGQGTGAGAGAAPPERASPSRSSVLGRMLPAEPVAGPDGQLVAIASSTGGVWILADLLRGLSPVGRSVVIAQHMESEFVPSFAEWLAGASGWRVRVVSERCALAPGIAYVPAGGLDLVVEPGGLAVHPASGRFVPSADRLLASAAALGALAAGVVLSGMGDDGANGLAAIARRGGRALCQSPATAVVPSMPDAALRRAKGAEAVAPDALAAALSPDRE